MASISNQNCSSCRWATFPTEKGGRRVLTAGRCNKRLKSVSASCHDRKEDCELFFKKNDE